MYNKDLLMGPVRKIVQEIRKIGLLPGRLCLARVNSEQVPTTEFGSKYCAAPSFFHITLFLCSLREVFLT